MDFRTAHTINEKERTKDIEIEETITFDEMYLSDAVLSGLHKCGFVRPSPIQLSAIPLGRCGLDLIVQAKSGTGKTCVFSVIALEMISVSAKTTQVLVIVPTREIAVQIGQVINSIGSAIPDLKASTFIGGTSVADDKAKLKCCHIAIGTPGRLNQLVSLGNLNLNNVRLLVLDEGDQLLTGQFKDCILELVRSLPLNKQVLTLSATYPLEVTEFLEKFMRSPSRVQLGKESPALIGVLQFVRLLPDHPQSHQRHKMKFSELLSILSAVSFNQCLVFSNSQLRAESICNQLQSSGWPSSYLTGGQVQEERLQAFFALCSYKCRILVSTDLSARGLDSEHVNLVINLDIPTDQATYLHRVGRAGRFGSKGIAISLVCEGEEWEAMRAVTTLTNTEIRILHEDYDSNTMATENGKLELVEHMSEKSCALWMEKQKARRTKCKSRTESKENICYIGSKLSTESNFKKQKAMFSSVLLNEVEKNNLNFEECRENTSLGNQLGDIRKVKNVLPDYSNNTKLYIFSYSEVLNIISENWETLPKYDTPNHTKGSCLREYPSGTVFSSLKLYIDKRNQEGDTATDIEDSESKKTPFNSVEVLQNVLRGVQTFIRPIKYLVRSEDDDESFNSNQMLGSDSPRAHDLIKTSSSSHSPRYICNGSEVEVNCHINKDSLYLENNVSNSNMQHNENASRAKPEQIRELKRSCPNSGNYKVKAETKENSEVLKAKNYAESTGYGEWKPVIHKPKSSSRTESITEKREEYKENVSFNSNSNHTKDVNYSYGCGHNSADNCHYCYSGEPEIIYSQPYSLNRSSASYNYNNYSQYCDSVDLYIKSAQKFVVMMDYIKNIGKMSAWIAQDQNKKLLVNHHYKKFASRKQRKNVEKNK